MAIIKQGSNNINNRKNNVAEKTSSRTHNYKLGSVSTCGQYLVLGLRVPKGFPGTKPHGQDVRSAYEFNVYKNRFAVGHCYVPIEDVVYLLYRYHRRNYAYWLLCLSLLPAAWAVQQHGVGQEHVKTQDNHTFNVFDFPVVEIKLQLREFT